MTPILQLIHPDDVERTRLLIDKLNIELTVQISKTVTVTKTVVIGFFLGPTSFDPLSKRLFAIARDITNERHYQSQLSQMHRVLNKETIVAMTNRAGDITEVNDKFCQISGYSKDELLGQNHRILIQAKHPRHFSSKCGNTISSGKTWAGKIENRAKNGEHYFVKNNHLTHFWFARQYFQFFSHSLWLLTEEVRNKEIVSRTLDIFTWNRFNRSCWWLELHIASGILTWLMKHLRFLMLTPRTTINLFCPRGLDLFVEEHKPIMKKRCKRAIDFGEPYELEVASPKQLKVTPMDIYHRQSQLSEWPANIYFGYDPRHQHQKNSWTTIRIRKNQKYS